MKKFFCMALTGILFLGTAVGCNGGVEKEEKVGDFSGSGGYPLQMEDTFGNEISFSKSPERVICYSPELLEILFALDLEEVLIGRSSYCNFPEEALLIPEMGDLFSLDLESLVDAKPDLVLLSSMSDEAAVNSIKNQGIPVLALDSDASADGVYSYIRALGAVFDEKDRAEKLCQEMQESIDFIMDKVAKEKKPTVYFVVGYGEFDSGATGDTFLGQLLEMAGGENVAADSSNWMYTIEELMISDPDIVICSQFFDMKEGLMAAPGYKDLSAVLEGRIFEVDENIFFRQGPRMVEAVEVLARIFHPDVFL